MQNAMREAAKQVAGSQQYINEQMKIFTKNEELKKMQKILQEQREQVADSFFKANQTMQSVSSDMAHLKNQLGVGLDSPEMKRLVESMEEQKKSMPLFKMDDSTKKMIDDAVKASQAIEGYTKVASAQVKKEAERIMKMYNVQVSTHRE